jgi:hypothetical protein
MAQWDATQLIRVHRGSGGCSVSQKGAAWLTRVQRSNVGCIISQYRVQCCTVGCSVAREGAHVASWLTTGQAWVHFSILQLRDIFLC